MVLFSMKKLLTVSCILVQLEFLDCPNNGWRVKCNWGAAEGIWAVQHGEREGEGSLLWCLKLLEWKLQQCRCQSLFCSVKR